MSLGGIVFEIRSPSGVVYRFAPADFHNRLSILLCTFYMCMNTANVYIVLSDGLAKRVEVILTREDAPELNNYFHSDFLSADPALTRRL